MLSYSRRHARLLRTLVAAGGVVALSSFSLSMIGVSAGASVKAVDAHKAKHPKKPTKKATATAGCSSFKPGSKGVTQTFCTGSAVVKITVGTANTVIKGGTCATTGGFFTVNAGVVVDAYSYKGAKPNYFGLEAKSGSSTFANAVLAFTVGGSGSDATKNTGTIAANQKSGTFTGTDLQGAAVSGSFTC
ncbi:MAG TPA: hypothetical protein VHV57_09560 [Acidimicrobiales bacterium]|nr:hypothetical protein [Acidimicrobiales bacterium]